MFEPELKRTKKLEKQRNEVLGEYKKSMLGSAKINEDQCEEGKHTQNRFGVQSILASTMKFKLSNRSETEIPINKKTIKAENNFASKINKYILPKNSEKTYSLCKFYDNNLNEDEMKPVISQELMEREKARKYQFTMSKLL